MGLALGSYPVTVKATTPDGLQFTIQRTVTVVEPPKSISHNASAGALWHATCIVSASVKSQSIAGDSAGDSATAAAQLTAVATGSELLDAMAAASASLIAGCAAGDKWVTSASAVAKLIDSAQSSDAIIRVAANALNGAVSEGTSASDRFIAAVETIAAFFDSASLDDAFVAVIGQVGRISGTASADSSFSVTFGNVYGMRSAAVSKASWLITSSLSAEITDFCTARDLIQASASVQSTLSAGARAEDRFAIVDDSVRYLVMGAITLRAALSQKVAITPGY